MKLFSNGKSRSEAMMLKHVVIFVLFLIHVNLLTAKPITSKPPNVDDFIKNLQKYENHLEKTYYKPTIDKFFDTPEELHVPYRKVSKTRFILGRQLGSSNHFRPKFDFQRKLTIAKTRRFHHMSLEDCL